MPPVRIGCQSGRHTNAFVCWAVHQQPWKAERSGILIGSVNLPLNLDQNRSHSFHAALTLLRATAKARARAFTPL